MRAVVVYESMFGNTHQVADAIGAGLAPRFDVEVVPVAQASPAVLDSADLVIVGGPTHAHGMSRRWTRNSAAKMAAKPGSEVTLEPDALVSGLRDWFGELGTYRHARAAAFDTRLAGLPAFTGRASKGVSRALRHHGFDLVADPESFVLADGTKVREDEAKRARAWGTSLATRFG